MSTTIFSNKPIGIITASTSGQKGHEELQLIMETLQAKFTKNTTLLIPGIKGKIDVKTGTVNEKTQTELTNFFNEFTLI